jgi:hypothetical protein
VISLLVVVVDQAKGAVLSGVVLTLADQGRDLDKAVRVVKVGRDRIAIKPRKFIMDSRLL